MEKENFKNWRNQMGITQSQVARLLHVTDSCVWCWESGKNKIPYFVSLSCSAIAHRLPPWRESAHGLREWRNKMGLSGQAAARAFGVSIRTITNWETSRGTGMPHAVALACAALYSDLEPWSINNSA